jgi:2-keto-4-pentenoate hydratase/2-oxohepta-3-ene-1,7-dioic acid hydratase in catechol pathway
MMDLQEEEAMATAFVSYRQDGPAWGALRDGHIVPGRSLLGGRYADLKSVLADGFLRRAFDEAEAQGATLPLSAVTLLPPIPDPAHVFCAGLNYAAHAAETGAAAPEAPRMFLRATSSLVAAGAPVIRPRVSERLDFEGELAVVIGRRGRHIAEADAYDYVAGYSCFMDGSIRDWQEHSVTTGKNFIGTGAFGPALVPAFAVPDVERLTLTTRLNGEEVQRTTTDLMVHTIPRLIAYLSAMTLLMPGDVIVTGTPEGVGNRRTPKLWMRPGDRVEVEISGVGLLSNPIVQEVEADSLI